MWAIMENINETINNMTKSNVWYDKDLNKWFITNNLIDDIIADSNLNGNNITKILNDSTIEDNSDDGVFYDKRTNRLIITLCNCNECSENYHFNDGFLEHRIINLIADVFVKLYIINYLK